MNINNQHQAHLSLHERFNYMRGCLYVRTLIFQNDCLSVSTPAYANQNLSFRHQTFAVEASGRGSVSSLFIATAQKQTRRWAELYSCHHVYRLCCKIMLVFSASEAPDPSDLCFAPSFVGSEENGTISISLKVIKRSVLHLKTLSIVESQCFGWQPATTSQGCYLDAQR